MDPFHRQDFVRRIGAGCAVVRAPQAARNDADGQKMAASGGADWPSGRVAGLARSPATRCTPLLTGRPLRRHEMGQYQGDLVLRVNAIFTRTADL